VEGAVETARAGDVLRERMADMLKSCPICCLMFDAAGRILAINDEAAEIFGESVVNTHMVDFVSAHSTEYQPDGRESDEKAALIFEKIFGSDSFDLSFEWLHTGRFGVIMPMEVHIKKARYSDGDVCFAYYYNLHNVETMREDVRRMNDMLGARLLREELITGITKAFLAENVGTEAIGGALERLGTFLQAQDAAVIPLGNEEDTEEYLWNDGSGRARGARGLRGLIGENYVATRDGRDDTRVYRRGDSSFIWSPVHFEGRLWGVLSVARHGGGREWSEDDIRLTAQVADAVAGAVERELYSRQRMQALKQAIEASHAKSNFLSNMSHEMRTPINAIIGMASIGKASDSAERKDYALAKIEEASAHLLGVINDVLDIAKIEANKLELTAESFSLRQTLKKCIDVVSFRLNEKRQEFCFNYDVRLPAVLVGDSQRLAQVVINLLSNAVKFTPEEGAVCMNAMLGDESGGMATVILEVTDSGVGIQPDRLPLLFKAFEQADSGISRKYGGTGLGLTISKRIIDLMDGDIAVESEPGKGSKFIVTFKAAVGDAPDDAGLDPSVDWEKLRIMVTDDSPTILRFFSVLFSHIGCVCDTVSDGESALELMKRSEPYDFCFIDRLLPGIDGIELLRQINERCPEKRGFAVLISATNLQQFREEALNAGASGFLQKPIYSSDVISCMCECIGVDGIKRHGGQQLVPGEFCGRRILLAEDIEINREILCSLLESSGAEIDCAANGIEALSMLERNPDKYDLVFMDVQMPEMDGLETTRRIRRNPRHSDLPIVAMTANVFKDDVDRCIQAGMDDHTGKPLNIDDVVRLIRAHNKNRRGYAQG
jgi:signal transduction histidine kinase/CheY-like chemotaxis protein